MVKQGFRLLFMGVLMATLLSAIVGCDTVDKKATEPILTQLSDKYGKSFSVYALGDRIDKDTATAFVFADDDPTMLFVARVTSGGDLVFENYAYRSICRKVETKINAAFTAFGIETECFTDFSSVNNSVSPDASVESYIKDSASEHVIATIIAKDGNGIGGDNLTEVYCALYSQLSGINLSTALYVLTSDDYDAVAEKGRHETQVFDAYRLEVSGAGQTIKELHIMVTQDGLSLSASEMDEVLAKGVD